jgi:SAM-dependent methyltransferase
MKEPVMDPNFWATRLKNSSQLRHSVFLCSDNDWEEINIHHYHMLTKYIDVKKDKVLEAGCGYGRWSPLFKNYTGVDISPDFINLAKDKFPMHKNNFICEDLKKLPFNDKVFDWCFTVSTKAMIIREVDLNTWIEMENELKRVAKKVLILEYSYSLPSNTNRDNVEII